MPWLHGACRFRPEKRVGAAAFLPVRHVYVNRDTSGGTTASARNTPIKCQLGRNSELRLLQVRPQGGGQFAFRNSEMTVRSASGCSIRGKWPHLRRYFSVDELISLRMSSAVLSPIGSWWP
jgi:hypothetical protein